MTATHDHIPIEPPEPSPYLQPWANPGAGTELARRDMSTSKFCRVHDYRWRGDEPCVFCEEAA